MSVSDKFNQVTKLFVNMQYQIFKDKKYILKNRDGLICSRYDEADFAEEIWDIYDLDKDHLQSFLAWRYITVEIEMTMQDSINQIFRRLSKGIYMMSIFRLIFMRRILV